MRARLLLTGTAIALTLCACSRTQATTAPDGAAAPAAAPLTFERHFGTNAAGPHAPSATGTRRSGDTHPHGPRTDDETTADDEGGADDGGADDAWADDEGWTDDEPGWGDETDEDSATADDEWADDETDDDAQSSDDEWIDDDAGWQDETDADSATADDEWADDETDDDAQSSDEVDDGTGYDDSGSDDETGGDGPVVDPASSPDLDRELADLRAAWSTAVSGTTATVIVVPSGQRVATACDDGSATYATSDDAFYCDVDDTIVLGADVISETQRDFGAGGIAFLLAHEYGHNLQVETGVDAYDSATAKPVELHADCLAGAYLADALHRGTIDAAALDQARAAAYAVGDDAVDDPDHHGTSQERLDALNRGISGADCKTYLG